MRAGREPVAPPPRLLAGILKQIGGVLAVMGQPPRVKTKKRQLFGQLHLKVGWPIAGWGNDCFPAVLLQVFLRMFDEN